MPGAVAIVTTGAPVLEEMAHFLGPGLRRGARARTAQATG
jgi:hypothetical protein